MWKKGNNKKEIEYPKREKDIFQLKSDNSRNRKRLLEDLQGRLDQADKWNEDKNGNSE